MKKIAFGAPNYSEIRKQGHKIADMHTHTEFSHDSGTKISEIAATAKRIGIGLAITDHNHIGGSLALKKRYPEIFQIPGIEITSIESKDILLYFNKHSDLEHFYNKHVHPNLITHKTNMLTIKTSLSTRYILDIAKDYNSLRTFPHPLVRVKGILRTLMHMHSYKIARQIDAIEVINSTQSKKDNIRSLAWANLEKKGITAGSDSHITSTLGNAVTYSPAHNTEDFLEHIRKKKNYVIGHSNTFYAEMSTLETIIKNKISLSKKET